MIKLRLIGKKNAKVVEKQYVRETEFQKKKYIKKINQVGSKFLRFNVHGLVSAL